MASMTSLRKNRSDHSPGFKEDCKAVFFCVTNNIKGLIRSPEELSRALQGCGKNPNSRKVEAYWKDYNKKIGLEEFYEIVDKEESVSEQELMNAFRCIDTDHNGVISKKELLNLLTTNGDQMTTHEVMQIMNEADLNGDGCLDYKEFIRLVFETIDKSKQTALRRYKRAIFDEDERAIDRGHHRGRNSSRERGNSSPLLRHSSLSVRSHDDELSERRHHRDREHRDRDRERERERERDRERERERERSMDVRRRPNSRLSNDGYDSDLERQKRASKMNLKNMLTNEVKITRAQSSDSLRSGKKRLSDSDSETERRRRSKSRDRDQQQKPAGKGKSAGLVELFEVKLPAQGRADAISEPKNLKSWAQRQIRGAFYFNPKKNAVLANTYALDLLKDTTLFISIEPYKTPLHTADLNALDMNLLIVSDNQKRTLKSMTENKIKNKWCCKIDLKSGRYFLFPFTSGSRLKERSLEMSEKAPQLFKKDLDKKKTLSRQFRDVLNVMFDMCDLDGNGRMSFNELNLYSTLSADEPISETDWKDIGKMVGFEKNELTRDGFIELYKMEAQQDDLEVDNIRQRLANMGFSQSLTNDHSCPFVITAWTEVDCADFLIGETYECKQGEQFIAQMIEAKGAYKPVAERVMAFEYHNTHWSTVQIRNDSRDEVLVEVSYARSENALGSGSGGGGVGGRGSSSTVKVGPGKHKIALFVTPENPSRECLIRYVASVSTSNASQVLARGRRN